MSASTVLERSHPGRRAQLKRDILAMALSCFNKDGIEATTIDVIRARCETSVGAIYHHFGNKDGLVAELFFCAQDDQASLLDERLRTATSAREGVEAMVHSYVDWVTSEPDLARFQFQARSFVARGPHADALAERNRIRNRALLAWLTHPDRKADLSRCPRDLLPSLIIGPAESYCRVWLGGRARSSPAVFRNALALAAWGAVEAVSSAAT